MENKTRQDKRLLSMVVGLSICVLAFVAHGGSQEYVDIVTGFNEDSKDTLSDIIEDIDAIAGIIAEDLVTIHIHIGMHTTPRHMDRMFAYFFLTRLQNIRDIVKNSADFIAKIHAKAQDVLGDKRSKQE